MFTFNGERNNAKWQFTQRIWLVLSWNEMNTNAKNPL